jgi:DNA-binding response OmpR family regulator
MAEATILVVDDEANIRLFLTETLSQEGYQVVAATSGAEAAPLIAGQDFDLALLDLMLPEMSGIEILALLRRQCPDTVVIILTAHGTLETAVEALRQGASDYLFKPCKPMQLRESVRQGLLKRERKLEQRRLLHQLEHIRATLTEVSFPPVMPPTPPAPSPDPPETSTAGRFLKYGGLLVDLTGHIITLNGHLLELSLTEFNLLAYLVSNAPRVVSPQELVQAVQGYSGEMWEARDIVRQHIFNTRHKIKEATGLSQVIRNVRGVGYTLME